MICYSTQSITWETLNYTALEITHHCTPQFYFLTKSTKKEKKEKRKKEKTTTTQNLLCVLKISRLSDSTLNANHRMTQTFP
jgi:hypothetical protein